VRGIPSSMERGANGSGSKSTSCFVGNRAKSNNENDSKLFLLPDIPILFRRISSHGRGWKMS
jgi:hypothetical protein